mmetsp:Transcript_5009/g.15991  ORF Transcript_5009/g.15991 Transcript_5009/m.15991 type:complete len:83 (+) Transcript_5009:322-570(+)
MSDPDLVRIVALAAQKLTCEIVRDARARTYGRQREERQQPDAIDPSANKKPKLVTKDLEGSLAKFGITSDVPPCLTGPSEGA